MSSENRAEQVSLEAFIEVATRAAIRAAMAAGVTTELNPQPLPPREDALPRLPHLPIIIGIWIDPQALRQE
jgi:hypothetical protein